jgi:hypothetical protein
MKKDFLDFLEMLIILSLLGIIMCAVGDMWSFIVG